MTLLQLPDNWKCTQGCKKQNNEPFNRSMGFTTKHASPEQQPVWLRLAWETISQLYHISGGFRQYNQTFIKNGWSMGYPVLYQKDQQDGLPSNSYQIVWNVYNKEEQKRLNNFILLYSKGWDASELSRKMYRYVFCYGVTYIQIFKLLPTQSSTATWFIICRFFCIVAKQYTGPKLLKYLKNYTLCKQNINKTA